MDPIKRAVIDSSDPGLIYLRFMTQNELLHVEVFEADNLFISWHSRENKHKSEGRYVSHPAFKVSVSKWSCS